MLSPLHPLRTCLVIFILPPNFTLQIIKKNSLSNNIKHINPLTSEQSAESTKSSLPTDSTSTWQTSMYKKKERRKDPPFRATRFE